MAAGIAADIERILLDAGGVQAPAGAYDDAAGACDPADTLICARNEQPAGRKLAIVSDIGNMDPIAKRRAGVGQFKLRAVGDAHDHTRADRGGVGGRAVAERAAVDVHGRIVAEALRPAEHDNARA
jgi:hypothetical protein